MSQDETLSSASANAQTALPSASLGRAGINLRTLKLAIRFSLREMRGGLSGLMIFLTCIALGVAAIGGVNSVARAISAGVTDEGQSLLGGDIRFELTQREATAPEHAFLNGLGTLAASASMRSMARLEDGSDDATVMVKFGPAKVTSPIDLAAFAKVDRNHARAKIPESL